MGVLLILVLLTQVVLLHGILRHSDWIEESSLSNRRFQNSEFQQTTKSVIHCVFSCWSNNENCTLVSYDDQSKSCYGYNNDVSTSALYDIASGAVVFKKKIENQEKCSNAGYTYEASVKLCFKFIMNPLSWGDAELACNAEGNRLVILDTTEKLEHIRSLIGSKTGYKSQVFWVSGSDATMEGSWVFTNGKSVPSGNSFWHTNEPNNGVTENCICLLVSTHYFYDCNCNSLFNYICEVNLE